MKADWRERLSRNPDICGGELCVRGTRVPVHVVMDNIAEGLTQDEILSEYPSLQAQDLNAVLAYAAEVVREEFVDVPLERAS